MDLLAVDLIPCGECFSCDEGGDVNVRVKCGLFRETHDGADAVAHDLKACETVERLVDIEERVVGDVEDSRDRGEYARGCDRYTCDLNL